MRKNAWIIIVCFIVLGTSSSFAELVSLNQHLTIRRTDGGLDISRDLDLQRRQTNEIIRGSDLNRAVNDLVLNVKNLLAGLKYRRTDQVRGSALSQISNDNAKRINARNKLNQQAQKRRQKDQLQAVKAKNRDLSQRIRDLTRR